MDLDSLVKTFARAVAIELAALQHEPVEYSQDAPPKGMSKRGYLDHCRRGDWPSRKVGRLRISRREDVEAYVAKRSATKRDIEDDDDAMFARITRRGSR